jgi:small GTP-binding protein
MIKINHHSFVLERNSKMKERTSLNGLQFTNNITQPLKSNYTTISFKLVLIGDINVGKTSILSRYLTNTFNENIKCSVSVDYKIKNIQIDKNLRIDLCIWDTCGQERFRNITKQYFRDSHAILLIFSLSDFKTFNNLNYWIDELNNSVNEDTFIYLFGNKSDEKNIDYNLINEFLNKSNIIKGYYEVSAKTGLNIEYAFNNICKELVNFFSEDKSFFSNSNFNNKESNISLSFKHKKKKNCC